MAFGNPSDQDALGSWGECWDFRSGQMRTSALSTSRQTKARSGYSLAAHFTKQPAKHCAGRLNESARSGYWTLVLFVHTAVSRLSPRPLLWDQSPIGFQHAEAYYP